MGHSLPVSLMQSLRRQVFSRETVIAIAAAVVVIVVLMIVAVVLLLVQQVIPSHCRHHINLVFPYHPLIVDEQRLLDDKRTIVIEALSLSPCTIVKKTVKSLLESQETDREECLAVLQRCVVVVVVVVVALMRNGSEPSRPDYYYYYYYYYYCHHYFKQILRWLCSP